MEIFHENFLVLLTRHGIKKLKAHHRVKIVQIRTISVFSPNTGKYGPEITTYLDTFHAMKFNKKLTDLYFMTSN